MPNTTRTEPAHPAASAARTLEITSPQSELLRSLTGGDRGAVTALDSTWASSPPRLSAEVLSVKRVPAGSGVSYGHTHVTEQETTLALVYLGYGHGLPRKAGNRASVTWSAEPIPGEQARARGRSTGADVSEPVRMPIVGRVAMDVLVVDAGDAPIARGHRVVAFGDPEAGEIAVTEWADAVGEMPAVLLVCLDARVIRVIGDRR